jgi:DNA-binding response OmpR family regulator/EAL domain-containing protein (putative c-di-GMP-specific phosphodiesterase class I)
MPPPVVTAAEIETLSADIAARALRAIPTWSVLVMAQLYEEVDTLASSADRVGLQGIADAAIELTVYLSSLVEAGTQASPAQREQATQLVQILARNSGAGAAASLEPKPVAAAAQSVALQRVERKHRIVLYVYPEGHELPGLAQQLGHERFVVRSLSEANRALAEARANPPDALIVDVAMVSILGTLLDTAERATGGERRRPLSLVLNDGGDVRQRLFAQRAGADAVLEGSDAERVVQRLTELFVAQRREDARILIVDDDRDMAMFCETVLGYKGMTTQVAHSARAALDALQEFKPDLVLLDLYMPDMNGIEVAQLIRERPDMALVPIIFMSGEENLDKRFDAIRMGGDDCLEKPVKPRHLIASVSSRVSRARLMASGHAVAVNRAPIGSGRLDRATLVHEIERSRRGELGECVGLLMLAVDDVPALARRLGFVRTGDLAQQIISVLALEPAFKAGICALGEFSFLALLPVSATGALRVAGENVRARLQGRGWLAADAPVKVSFTLGIARVDEGAASIDEVLAQLSGVVHALQEQGGGRSQQIEYESADVRQESPEQKLARAILKRQLHSETTRLSFRNLVPMRGQHAGQFLVKLSLVAPRANSAIYIEAEHFVPIAHELNVIKSVDRWLLHAAGKRAAAHIAKHGDTRLFVPLSPESLAEPAFGDWLLAELMILHIDADALALVLDAAALSSDVAKASRLIDQLQSTGARVCLTGFTDGARDQLRLCRLSSTYANILSMTAPATANAGEWPELRRKLIHESLRHGKIVIVENVDDPTALGELFRENVHYVIGDGVGQWSTDLSVSEIRLG